MAYPDDKLNQAHTKLSKEFPNLKFKSVATDLSKVDGKYMEDLKEGIRGIEDEIGIVFNNAGYIRFGEFDKSPIEEHLKHIECNSLSHIRITHYFYQKMKEKKRGLICFTSSSVS